MPRADVNGIAIEYEIDGPPDGRPLLLIHGVGAQLVRWPEALCAAFAEADFRVIRFDNRDVGLSTHFRDGTVPPYTVSDMARDAVALLDALGIRRAHVLGVSLGGMIAQTMAIEHATYVRSLAIFMSRSGNAAMPPSDPALLSLLATPAPDPVADLAAYVAHSIDRNRALGSPAYPTGEVELRAMAEKAARRDHDPAGTIRQLAASRAMGDLRAGLRRLTVPTLVVHGADDRLIPSACGEDIARNVAESWFLQIAGMGHDVPAPLFDLFVDLVARNARRALPGPV